MDRLCHTCLLKSFNHNQQVECDVVDVWLDKASLNQLLTCPLTSFHKDQLTESYVTSGQRIRFKLRAHSDRTWAMLRAIWAPLGSTLV